MVFIVVRERKLVFFPAVTILYFFSAGQCKQKLHYPLKKKEKKEKRRDFAITKYTLFHTKNLSQEVMTRLVILWLLAIYPLRDLEVQSHSVIVKQIEWFRDGEPGLGVDDHCEYERDD